MTMTDDQKKQWQLTGELQEFLNEITERRAGLRRLIQNGEIPEIDYRVSPKNWERIVNLKIVPDAAKTYIELAIDHCIFMNTAEGVVARTRPAAEAMLLPLMKARKGLEKYHDVFEGFQQIVDEGRWSNLDERLDQYRQVLEEMTQFFTEEAEKIGHRPSQTGFHWFVFDLDTIVRHYSHGKKHIDRSKKMRAFVVEVCREVKSLPKDTSADDVIVWVQDISEGLEER
jgi:hypothetical protein